MTASLFLLDPHFSFVVHFSRTSSWGDVIFAATVPRSSLVAVCVNNQTVRPLELIAETPVHDVLIAHGLGLRQAESQGVGQTSELNEPWVSEQALSVLRHI